MSARQMRNLTIAGVLCVPLVLAHGSFADDSPETKKKNPETQNKNGDRQVNDQSVCDAVKREFQHDRGVPEKGINVSCANSRVTLKGTVHSLSAKRRAANVAETVRGVRSVDNQIEIQAGDRKSKAPLKDDVKSVLANDPATDEMQINVESPADGKIKLTGTVGSLNEKYMIEDLAGTVHGVIAIDNQLTLRKSDLSDEALKTAAQKALRRNALVDDGMIDMKVKDQKVTLSGTVASAAEWTEAKTSAWIAGVQDVDASDLKIEKWARTDEMRNGKNGLSDSEIESSIRDALLSSPRVYSFNVQSKVRDGNVTLTGTVDNLKAKRTAETVAMYTVGVQEVDNKITVRSSDRFKDEDMKSRIENSMLINPYVSSFEVGVRVEDGVAHLSGTVDSFYEKAEADDIASRTSGITDVKNEIDVKYEQYGLTYNPYADDWYAYGYDWYVYPTMQPRENDNEIADEIQDELWWSPFVDSDEVHVSVKDGVATLTGEVDSLSEYRSAAENAREGGAVRVVNQLTIDS